MSTVSPTGGVAAPVESRRWRPYQVAKSMLFAAGALAMGAFAVSFFREQAHHPAGIEGGGLLEGRVLTQLPPASLYLRLVSCAIFLDMDGVMLRDRFSPPLSKMIDQKLVELFGTRDRYREYSELQFRIAQSYFLDQEAIDNLNRLIFRVSSVAQVIIVFSSAWRLDGDVDQIVNQMFKLHPFAKYIVDKTGDDDWWRARNQEPALSPIAAEKYGLRLNSRGAQILYWILENTEKWSLCNFVILDDFNNGLSEHFPKEFVQVGLSDLLSKADVDKAYHILTAPLCAATSLKSSA